MSVMERNWGGFACLLLAVRAVAEAEEERARPTASSDGLAAFGGAGDAGDAAVADLGCRRFCAEDSQGIGPLAAV